MIVAIIFACADKSTDTETLEIESEYYTASTLITLEESEMEFEEGYIVRRTLDPSIDEIFEEFYSTTDGTLVSVTLDVNAQENTFSLSFSDDSYFGEGSFVGTGLHWDSWESRSSHIDGTYVVSEDEKDSSGVIHTQKIGYSITGSIDWRLEETLTPIAEAAFQSQLDQLNE